MSAQSQEYCLRWNNHRSNLLNVFSDLLQNEAFTDVTLAVDNGRTIKCHKIVLAACSSYFQNLFFDLPCKHPIVILKDVKHAEIKAILQYMYHGEVNVAQEELGGLLKVAEALKVKGLVEEHGGNGERPMHSDIRREDTMDTSMSPPPVISTSTNSAAAHSSSHTSPPHSTCGAYGLYKSAISVDRGQSRLASTLPIGWPLSGLSVPAGHQSSPHSNSANTVTSVGSYDNSYEASPMKRSRKYMQPNLLMNRDTPILRTVLGQGHADNSLSLLQSDSHDPIHFRASSNGSTNDNDNRRSSTDLVHTEAAHSPYTDPYVDEDEKQPSPQSYPGDTKSGIANYVPSKPEWKRYKQYTRDDIQAAIEAVKSGMSAVQAARKHGVPSRTLYDKVKKLGITTSRPFKRTSNGSSGACFPYGIGGNVNGSIYSGAMSENENENSANVVENIINTAVLDSAYAKVASDIPQDRDSMSDLTARCSPSPVIRCAKQKQHQQQNINDEVEDLSLNRKSDVPVIVPPSIMSDTIKDETQDSGPDNSDYN